MQMLFPAMDVTPIRITPVTASAVRSLRRAVLMPGSDLDSGIYHGDEAVGTLHLGGFAFDDLVAVASVCRETFLEVADTQSWRLRGMAVDHRWRRRGIGNELVSQCLVHAAEHGGARVWCIAREAVTDFYRSLGFAAVGPLFKQRDRGDMVFCRMVLTLGMISCSGGSVKTGP
jgi:predicted GNAT family N-acyltransferase